jgi:diaminopimelate decarboxylase
MSPVLDPFGRLQLGGVSLAELVGEVGTPTYVYDVDAMAAGARELVAAFGDAPHLVAYAVKANTAGRVIRAMAGEGCGADVVSGAELRVALGCGIAPDRVVYSGVAKTDEELDEAIGCGPRGICAVQVESLEEIGRVEARARAASRRARVGIRVNPSLDLKGLTHASIATGHDEAKFGVPRVDFVRAVERIEASPHLELVGIGSHLGSQFMGEGQHLEAARMLFDFVRTMRGGGGAKSLAFVSVGGGFGVDYTGELADPLRPADFVTAVRTEQRGAGLDGLALVVEPGRSLVAPHAVLLAQVIQTKVAAVARWLMIDAGMNDLMRPALYQARHRIVPLVGAASGPAAVPWRVVGPVCESSDDFGEHLLPSDAPDAVAILDAGAYGYTMANRYNGRQLPVEAFLSGGRLVSSTRREPVDGWVADRLSAGC